MAVLVCLTSASLEYYSQSTDVIRKTKLTKDRCRRLEVFCKKIIFKNLPKFTENRLCRSLFLGKQQASRFQYYQKKAPAQVVFSEFCEIFKSTYVAEYLLATASLQRVNHFTTNRFFIMLVRITLSMKSCLFQMFVESEEFYYQIFPTYESKTKIILNLFFFL